MDLKKVFTSVGLLAAAACIPMAANAQFAEGDNVLGVGVGVLGGYGIGYSGSGVNQSPALNFHFDHGMGELGPGTWGLGGYLGYKSATYRARYLSYYDINRSYTFLVVGARGTWHYNEWHDSNWDTYGVLMLAYNSVSVNDKTNYGIYDNTYSSSSGGIDLGIGVGARYYFNDKIGAYGELGYGLTWLQLGLAVKL